MRRAVIVLVVIVLAAGLGAVGVAEVLSRPVQRVIGAPPADLPFADLTLQTTAGRPVSGWASRGRPGAGVVVLLHGVRASRRQMVSRARFFHHLGYAVVLIDLPAHGESPAARITYGFNEASGVRAALAFAAREWPGEPVGVVGVSLGAASLVLARPDPAPQAVVLESMFPSIDDAVADRLSLHLGGWSRPLAPLLLRQLPWRLGITPAQLRPIDALPALHAPVLIVGGELDEHTTLPETKRLFEAANAPKELWIVDDAAHVDLHAFAPSAYEARIGGFLARYFRAGSSAAPARP